MKKHANAKNTFDGCLHSMRFAVEGSGENRELSDKLDSEEKKKITDALKDGQYWIDSNPKADVDRENEKQWTQRQLAGRDNSS